MGLQSLRFPGLQLADPNAEYSGEQVIYLDFDGEKNVSYDNKTLGLTVGGITVLNSGLSEDEIAEIVRSLNTTFADTGVTFTIDWPLDTEEYSTIYIGETGNAFSDYGSFLGLSETIDAGNQIKTDEAFVFSDKLDTPAALTETITHETAHLLGYQHKANQEIVKSEDISIIDFASSASSRATYGVTFVTHGFGFWGDDPEEEGCWLNYMCSSIANSTPGTALYVLTVDNNKGSNIGGSISVHFNLNSPENGIVFGSKENTSGKAVVLIDWSDLNGGVPGISTISTETIAESISDYFLNSSSSLLEAPLHLIGHSRGGSLIGALAEDFGQVGIWVDQTTFLDPHPIDDDWGRNGITVPWNVYFSDDYYRQGDWDLIIPNGMSVNGATQIKLDDSYLSGGYSNSHSDVHLWYQGTIDSGTATIDDNDISKPVTAEKLSLWYLGGNFEAISPDVSFSRTTTGYYYSLERGGHRPSSGLSQSFGGTGDRSNIVITSNYADCWANIGYLSTAKVSYTTNEDIEVNYRYSNFNKDNAIISFYLDDDCNPYNNTNINAIANAIGKPLDVAQQLKTVIINNANWVGEKYILAKISVGGNTRYSYLPQPIEISNANISIGSVSLNSTSLKRRQILTITANNVSGSNNVSYVNFLVDGKIIGADNDSNNGWSIDYNTENMTVGSHSVSIQAYDSWGNSSNAVSRSINITATDNITDNNNIYTKASDLGVVEGELLFSNLSITSGDVDVYKFTLTMTGTADHKIHILISGKAYGTGNIDIAIAREKNGALVGAKSSKWYQSIGGGGSGGNTQDTSDEWVSLEGRGPGTYYVIIYGHTATDYYYDNITDTGWHFDDATETNNYKLWIEAPMADAFESDNNWTTAKKITLDGQVQIHAQDGNDVDWVTFTIHEGYNVTISLSSFYDVNSNALNSVLELYQANVDATDVNRLAKKTGTNGTAINMSTQLSAGIYYLKVSHEESNDVKHYEISVSGTVANHAPIVTDPVEDHVFCVRENISFTISSDTFNDVDNDTLSFSAKLEDGSALPSWLTFNSTTNTFSGTSNQTCELNIKVTAEDGYGNSVSDVFVLSVQNFPDLVFDGSLILSTTSVSAGDSFTVSGTLKNTGGADAGASVLYIYRSDNSSMTEGNMRINDAITINAISSNNGQSFSTTISTEGWAPGVYYIGAIADVDDDITEGVEGEANNHSSGVMITVNVPCYPDVSVLGGGGSNDAYEIVSGDTTPGTGDDTDFGTVEVSGGSIIKTFTIKNTGKAALDISGFSLSDTGNFSFTGGNTARSLGVGESTTFSVRFDPAGTGTKSCTVTITSDDPDEGTYVFTIQGTGTESVLAVSTSALDFGSSSTTANFTVRNSGTGTLSYTLTEGLEWLSLSVVSGTSTGEADSITASIDRSKLGYGVQTGTITIDGNGGTQAITVSADGGVEPQPVLAVSASALDFGNSLNTLNFTVSNSGTGTLDYTLSEGLEWLSLSVVSGTSTGEADSITASIDRGKLSYGVQTGTITITGNGGTQAITVSADSGSEPVPVLTISTTVLDFGNSLNSQSFTVRNSGTGTLEYTLTEGLDWLSLSVVSGTSTGEADAITASIDRSKLGYGVQTGTITVTGNGGMQTITVSAQNQADDNNWQTAPVLEATPGEEISDEWVGFGDRIDYRKLLVDVNGTYSLALTGLENAVKLTLYTVNSKGELKTLKKLSVTPKFDKAGNVIKNDSGTLSGLLLTAGNEYYISVEATKAATSKNTGYDFSINGVQFLEANQAADDDWRTAPVLEVVPGESIGGEWVGFGDRIDYRKLQVDETGSYTLTISELENAAKLTLYTVDSKGALKVVKKISVTPKFDKAGNVIKNDSGILFGILLSAESEYYISVEATKATTAKNTGYELIVDGVCFDNPRNAIANNNWGDLGVEELDLSEGLFGEWVGFGDATDFFRFDLSAGQAGSYGFNLEPEIDQFASMTIYKVTTNKSGKVILTQVKAKNGQFQLGEGEYAVKVASADRGKGNKNTGYGIAIDLPDLDYWRRETRIAQADGSSLESFEFLNKNKTTGFLA